MASNKITDPGHDFIENCIWMSYRYCIGRHTIAAAMHAPSIAQFMAFNPDVMADDRRKFMALDIRREINNHMRWHNVSIDSSVCDNVNLAEEVLNVVERDNLDLTRNWQFKFRIDPNNQVDAEYEEVHDPTNTGSLWTILSDLLPWIKLEHYLDPEYEITFKNKDEEETKPGFAFYIIRNDGASKHWITCEKYAENPYIDVYLAGDCLICCNQIIK